MANQRSDDLLASNPPSERMLQPRASQASLLHFRKCVDEGISTDLLCRNDKVGLSWLSKSVRIDGVNTDWQCLFLESDKKQPFLCYSCTISGYLVPNFRTFGTDSEFSGHAVGHWPIRPLYIMVPSLIATKRTIDSLPASGWMGSRPDSPRQ